ncbi:hypothetical protein SLEP1_g11512 [Rubroshorea leprosula]|uniref:Uncharacterized protein n=1 Tax=Rubroshorea leprosula TaxID=152421 RepID=A0AAV5IG28_9ROSI|nr:hypothetical protein SLEP1_g11512 [Rubroshorea leprosula]
MSNIILFEDIFVVDQLDPSVKKFDKVTRIEARSQNCKMFMHLDVNAEIYPMHVGENFPMALAHTLNMDGVPDTGYYAQVYFCLGGRKSLADKYEYIMHGKLYKISEESSGKLLKAYVFIYISNNLLCEDFSCFVIYYARTSVAL